MNQNKASRDDNSHEVYYILVLLLTSIYIYPHVEDLRDAYYILKQLFYTIIGSYT